jgi:hydroxyethylthiazole kinase-like uncharacterized protein yjeF
MKPLFSDKITSEEMSILDNNAEWLGIPKSHLMECAGYSLANEVINRGYLKKNSKVAIFCGTGNNGGDGFVVARHLSTFGVKSLVILLGMSNNIRTEEAKLNWNIITIVIKDSTDLVSIGKMIKGDKKYHLIIDGLLGTGIKGKLREPIASTIDLINNISNEEQSRIKVISIDIPSGFDPNTGKVLDKAIRADLVVTFHKQKVGMEAPNEYMKEILEKSIGIPPEADLFVGKGDLLPTLKYRKVDAYKGQFGKILVIGGSKNYSGAPTYTSLTAINFGCDLVITYVPEVVGDVVRSYSPNLIVRTKPGNWLNKKALEEIKELATWADTIVIGPGLGLEKETEDLLVDLCTFLKENKKSYVIDADGLKLIKNHMDLVKSQNVILTPHAGELKIMADIDLPPYDQIGKRGDVIYKFAKKNEVVLLVKGPYDYITNGHKLKINKTGCPEMSIGGTGDVLAGLCASFLATKNDPFKSACSAAFLNGYIGEFSKKTMGNRFTAVDMINNINNVINTIINS